MRVNRCEGLARPGEKATVRRPAPASHADAGADPAAIPAKYLTLSDVKQALSANGLSDREALTVLASAARRDRLPISGMQQITAADGHATTHERRPVNNRLWAAFLRCLDHPDSPEIIDADWPNATFSYRLAQEQSDCPAIVECWLSWARSSASFCIRQPGQDDVQNVWRSILADAPAVECLVRDTSERRLAGTVLQEDEVKVWIKECPTENSKSAWALFKSKFGSRAGKKVVFEQTWRRAKGNRSRGRPPTQAN